LPRSFEVGGDDKKKLLNSECVCFVPSEKCSVICLIRKGLLVDVFNPYVKDFLRNETEWLSNTRLKSGPKAENMLNGTTLIWPELSTICETAGISEYSIFFDDRNQHLAFKKVVSCRFSELMALDCTKWWAYIADLMDVNEMIRLFQLTELEGFSTCPE
jgi:L-rhamnose mutarotase